jgi:hypothetical protein
MDLVAQRAGHWEVRQVLLRWGVTHFMKHSHQRVRHGSTGPVILWPRWHDRCRSSATLAAGRLTRMLYLRVRQDVCMTSDPDKDLTTAALVRQLDVALINVGLIVGQGAMMERVLEQAFCALVGSKFAAVVAAGQDVARLIEDCRALTKAHSELSGEDRQAILDALSACGDANKRRSQVVHSIHFPMPDLRFPYQGATVQTVKSVRRTAKDTFTTWTLWEMRKVAGELATASTQLLDAVGGALGQESLRLVEELRNEANQAGG